MVKDYSEIYKCRNGTDLIFCLIPCLSLSANLFLNPFFPEKPQNAQIDQKVDQIRQDILRTIGNILLRSRLLKRKGRLNT